MHTWMKLRKITIMAGLLLTISRCSTVSDRGDFGVRAPNGTPAAEGRSKVGSQSNDPAWAALQNYQQSRANLNAGDFVEACEGFRAVALEGSLPEPVRALARVRTLLACPADRVIASQDVPKWLAEEHARASVAFAQKSKDNLALAVALRDLAPFEKTAKLRESNLSESIRLLENSARDPMSKAELQKTKAKLIQISPRFYLQDSSAAEVRPSLLAIATDLRSARQFDRARAIYLQAANDKNLSPQERLKALDGIRMSFKLQLRTEDFLRATSNWLKFAEANFLKPGLKKRDASLLRVYLETGIMYARAIWTDHRPSDADRFLGQLEERLKNYSGRIPLFESTLIRARIAEEKADFNRMHEILSTINIEDLPDRVAKAKILWYRGWNLRRLPGRSEMAIGVLEQSLNYEDSHGSLTRNMYWLGRLHKDLGKTDVANKYFNDLLSLSPFGYYGVLAAHELGTTLSPLKTFSPEYSSRQSSPLSEVIRVPVDWFIALGEIEVGRRYFESFPAKETWDQSFSREKKEATLVLLSRLEQHIQVTIKTEELSPEDRKAILEKRPELIFPTPYQARIREEAARHRMDPALVYSIIRQESLFNPYARSHADAFGLMQLIPEMAGQAAKRIGISLESPDDLYDPDKNIALGTVFLKDLFTKYGDRFILSVAAYNANDKAIQGWLRTRMRKDPLEFIEEIPYDETRLYVKLVLRNFVTYQRRLGQTSVQFPEWTLRLSNVSN
ncbi:MAG: lytic transglycosylase domain-containing protein [Bdellovibrionales bacterium]|nr:lytic transglycosylase domain-containing protein [Bdellovibrionales bacterium]